MYRPLWRVTIPWLVFAILGALVVLAAPGNAVRAGYLKPVPVAYALVYAAIETLRFTVQSVINQPLTSALLLAVGASIDSRYRPHWRWVFAGLVLMGAAFFIPALVGLQTDLRATFYPAALLSGLMLYAGYMARWYVNTGSQH